MLFLTVTHPIAPLKQPQLSMNQYPCCIHSLCTGIAIKVPRAGPCNPESWAAVTFKDLLKLLKTIYILEDTQRAKPPSLAAANRFLHDVTGLLERIVIGHLDIAFVTEGLANA